MLRARLTEANARASADPSLRIGARHEAALEVLLTSKSCAHILHCCKTLGKAFACLLPHNKQSSFAFGR